MSRSIIKKAVGVGSSTLLSRFFAYIREMLLIQYLGIGVISDAFFLGLRLPNSLRKVFAEGALSSVLVPAFIHAERQDGHAGMNKLLTLSFLVIEAVVGLVVVGMYFFADYIIYGMAPGASAQQLQAGVQFLRILAPFLLFLSSSAVLAAALQATHRFFVPAIAPAFLNLLYVLFLLIGLYFSWSVSTFCWFMILATVINFLMHIWVCLSYNFTFALPDKQSWQGLFQVILQLLPCLLSVGIGEINFWIDSGFASYLESGTLSLLRYAYQFVNIPLGVMATSLSIVLLPYFSKIGHSKDELGVYLSEAIKFVVWMMLPMTIIMIFCSREIFETMFFSDKFTSYHVTQAQWNMNAYLLGLTFFALEKILLNAFYALRPVSSVKYYKLADNKYFQECMLAYKTGHFKFNIMILSKFFYVIFNNKKQNFLLFLQIVPPVAFATAVASLTIGMNFFMNSWLMGLYGGMGLALATTITAGVRIVMFITILVYYFGINFHLHQLWQLLLRYCLQLIVLGSICISFAIMISRSIAQSNFSWSLHLGGFSFLLNADFFLHSFGYWIWFGPLTGLFFLAIYGTRKLFQVSFSYLE